MVTDLIAVLRAEESLSDSEALYHSPSETMYMCLLRKDLNGRFTLANAQFLSSSGKAAEEVIGRTGRRSMVGKRVEISAQHRDGRMFDVEMAMQPIPDDGRTVFALFLHDNTDRKRAEEEIAGKN